MPVALILPQYFFWHYTKGLLELFQIWWNVIYFIFYFFSLPQLLKTLLAPWKRMGEKNRKGFQIEALFETLVYNLVIRTVGFLVRATTIILGTVTLLLVISAGILAILFWLVLPVAIILLLVASVKLIFGI